MQKVGETQSIETADSLLEKRDAIMKEIEDKKELLLSEKNKMESETVLEAEAGDALDAYMSGVSSQLGETIKIKIYFSLLLLCLDFCCI